MEEKTVKARKIMDERIPVSLPVKLNCANSQHSGIALNVSKTGMFIKTGISLPCDNQFDVCVPVNGHDLTVSVKLVRLSETFGFFDAVGVEVLNPTPEYLEFIANLRPAL